MIIDLSSLFHFVDNSHLLGQLVESSCRHQAEYTNLPEELTQDILNDLKPETSLKPEIFLNSVFYFDLKQFFRSYPVFLLPKIIKTIITSTTTPFLSCMCHSGSLWGIYVIGGEYFWLHHAACMILVPWPATEIRPAAVKAPGPSHRTAILLLTNVWEQSLGRLPRDRAGSTLRLATVRSSYHS